MDKNTQILGYKYQIVDKTTNFVFANADSYTEAEQMISDFNAVREMLGQPVRQFEVWKRKVIGILYVS